MDGLKYGGRWLKHIGDGCGGPNCMDMAVTRPKT